MQGQIQTEARNAQPVYVGVDVCKAHLDVYFHPFGEALRVANDRAGVRRLKWEVARYEGARVVLEATDKYHSLANRSLSQSGVAVTVVNPLRARLFAEALGTRAKTDRVDARMLALLDARMLALLGDALAPQATPPLPEALEALQELVHARNAATTKRTALINRLAASQTVFLKSELKRRIISLETHIAWLNKELERRIDVDPARRGAAPFFNRPPPLAP